MAIIKLNTLINASVQTCFDLSRSIDLHVNSMKHTGERAVAGKITGLLQVNDQVTWEAKHFGIRFRMTIRISEMVSADFFVDEMVTGPFKLIRHLHTYIPQGNATLMTDEFIFRSPYNWLGKLVDKFVLTTYMRRLLLKRNAVIKQAAEASVAPLLKQEKFAILQS